MNILYIHGLHSLPRPDRLGLLQQRGHQTFALHIDYEKEPDPFGLLKQCAIDNQVNFIVGSSAGGYIGYWLGHDLGIPQLLLNPAVTMRDIEADLGRVIPIQTLIPSWVALGVQDTIVPHDDTATWFKDKSNARVISCHWLEHQIDFQSFKEIIGWCGL